MKVDDIRMAELLEDRKFCNGVLDLFVDDKFFLFEAFEGIESLFSTFLWISDVPS